MQDAREDRPQTQRPPRSSSACTSSHSRPPALPTPFRIGVPHTVPPGKVTTTTAAESPQVIERIIAQYSRMRTDVEHDDGGDDNTRGEDVADEDCMDDDDESDEDDDAAAKEVSSTAGETKPSKRRGRSKAREEGGGADAEGGGGSTRQKWHLDELLVLVWCKRDLDDHMASQGSKFARMKTKTWKWNEIAKRMAQQGVTNRDGDLCMKRWENIFGWYRKIWDSEKDTDVQSLFLLTSKKRKEQGYKFAMDRQIYDAIHATTPNNQAIHPPNLHDTGGLPPQQPNDVDQSQGRGPTVVGETSASDNMDSGAGDGYGSRSSRGGLVGKRKNARQLAFDAVTDVMWQIMWIAPASVNAMCCNNNAISWRGRPGRKRNSAMCLTRRGSTSSPSWIATHMEIDVALRGRVLGRSVVFYEMRHWRGNDYGRDFGFENGVSKHDVRHYEIDADGDTCLHLTVGFGFGRGFLRQLVVFAQKVGTTIPDRWSAGVDVLAEFIDLLVSNVAMGYTCRLHDLALYVVQAEPPLANREYLHSKVRVITNDFY
ncbi:hypothetical protein CBR_g6558 [Chara braunii]|uniref:Myb-like domain-containing protein n=1 Tax=Chara braunii TaxID=69332 RepID=A0A388KK43_CHABU|nr:hypothetical protein CBR_g6558 [Chara braunii]|eukprot:GBG70430.1 hypothetical protein CBR_g6558 [Chara braunii]